MFLIFMIKKREEFIEEEISFLKESVNNLKEALIVFGETLQEIKKEQIDLKLSVEGVSTRNEGVSTNKTDNSTHNTYFKPLNNQIYPISIGNEGVSTDRQTHRQTDILPIKSSHNTFEEANRVIGSLDTIKQEIRKKFRNLTEQEMLIFSTIYQLEEELEEVNYKLVSSRLGLTESSIRDYVSRLIYKGIPLEKKRINNKSILLSISSDLKKIAPLPTINQLRDL